MRSDNYSDFFRVPYLMGPNSLRLLDELLESYPLNFTENETILDLGCGSGLTSLFLARETGAKVYANDLWVPGESNRKRIEEWGMEDRIISVHEDAENLGFNMEMFDAVVSIDAYHYFGGREGFLSEKVLPFVKHGGTILICVPGIKSQYLSKREAMLGTWLGEEAYLFRSVDEWKKIIGTDYGMETPKIWEMFGFYKPWQEWFATEHEYALKDKTYFDNVIRPFTCFIGIMIKKR